MSEAVGSAPVSGSSTPASSTPSQSGPSSSPSPGSSPASTGTGSQSPSSTGTKGTSATTNSPGSNAPEYFDVKVNGKIQRMTRQEVLDHASMASMANQKFEEAAKIRRDWEEKQKKYSQNPIQAFLDHANTLPPEQRRKAIEDYYMREFLEPEQMTAEQKRLRAAEERLKQYEQQELQRKQQEEQQQQETLTNQQRELMQQQIVDALESSGLPKTPATVSRIAYWMRQNLLNGWDAPMDMIIRQVKNERQQMYRNDISTASAEQIIEMMGEDLVNKIRRYDLEKLRAAREGRLNPPVQTSQPRSGPAQMENQTLTMSDVNKRLRDMRSGKFV